MASWGTLPLDCLLLYLTIAIKITIQLWRKEKQHTGLLCLDLLWKSRIRVKTMAPSLRHLSVHVLSSSHHLFSMDARFLALFQLSTAVKSYSCSPNRAKVNLWDSGHSINCAKVTSTYDTLVILCQAAQKIIQEACILSRICLSHSQAKLLFFAQRNKQTTQRREKMRSNSSRKVLQSFFSLCTFRKLASFLSLVLSLPRASEKRWLCHSHPREMLTELANRPIFHSTRTIHASKRLSIVDLIFHLPSSLLHSVNSIHLTSPLPLALAWWHFFILLFPH